MDVANTPAYYDTAIITAAKSFKVQAQGIFMIKHFLVVASRSESHKTFFFVI
jgi:hypothetical protein